jgi:hypothetical protein
MGFVPLPILQLLVFFVGWVERSETHHGAGAWVLQPALSLWRQYGTGCATRWTPLKYTEEYRFEQQTGDE